MGFHYVSCPHCGSISLDPTELEEYQLVCLACNRTFYADGAEQCNNCRDWVHEGYTRPCDERTLCEPCYRASTIHVTNHLIDAWFRHQ